MARFASAAFRAVVWATLTTALGALVACSGSGSINGPVRIAAGQKTGDVATVNGEITVGDGATIGEAMAVNGGVKLGSNVTAQSVKTVNGEVELGADTKVSGTVKTVNGEVSLEKGADVSGKLSNINGKIQLASAHVGGGIITINGDIDVGSGSRVEGGIRVETPTMSIGDSDHHDIPRVVIGPNAIVQGPLKFEHEVKLYVSESATIGPVEGATAEKFSGDRPPGDSSEVKSAAASDAPTDAASESAPKSGPEKE
jgi:DUF4097 and DUF4098 domain-containing protein YvlB